MIKFNGFATIERWLSVLKKKSTEHLTFATWFKQVNTGLDGYIAI